MTKFIGTQKADTLNGFYDNDLIRMRGGNDDVFPSSITDTTVKLGTGADVLEIQEFSGDNYLYGGRGHEDVLKIDGVKSDFTIDTTDDGRLMITDSDGDTLLVRGFESIQFDDGALMLQTGPNSEAFVFV